MFPDKRWNVSGLKTPDKKVVSTGTIERLPGSGGGAATDQHAQLQIIVDIPDD